MMDIVENILQVNSIAPITLLSTLIIIIIYGQSSSHKNVSMEAFEIPKD